MVNQSVYNLLALLKLCVYMIIGHYSAGVLDDGDVIIWNVVDTKLPPLKISSPLSGGGQVLSRGSKFMPII